jgi:hypothetical protein
MPIHTQSKTEKKPCGAGRSAVTGRALGKAAMRAMTKNAESVDQFVEICERAPTAADMYDALERAALILARVTRTVGGGRIQVQLYARDGVSEDVSVPIGGSIRMKGKAATKTDRANCMCQGDFVVVRGGIAAGKMSAATVAYIRGVFSDLEVMMPRGFFVVTDDDTETFEFDRSEQAANEAVTISEVRARAARASALRAGTAVTESVPGPVDIDAI